MNLPFDLEDVIGVALADLLRRVGLIVASVAGASWLAALGLTVGELLVARSLDSELVAGALGRGLWLFLAPLLTGWAVLYVPLVLAGAIYFTKADDIDPRVFVAALFLIAAFICISASPPWWFSPSWLMAFSSAPPPPSNPAAAALIWRGIGLGIVTGSCGCFAWLAWIWRQRQEAAQARHLIELTAENERRRNEFRETLGTEIADSDFARDDRP